jgi:hypothetical protein
MTDDFFIPVAVNGTPAKYGFDSGMDISMISEAEANRLRLPIQEVSASTLRDGASGNAVCRVAAGQTGHPRYSCAGGLRDHAMEQRSRAADRHGSRSR